MMYIESVHQFKKPQRGALTIGVFDGLHLGHQKLIQRTNELAQAENKPSILYTFDPHPISVISPDKRVERLFPIEELRLRCQSIGMDYLIVEPFTLNLAQTNAETFFEEYIFKTINPAHLIVGEDFKFGSAREGDVNTLKRWEERYHFQLEVIKPYLLNDQVISSSLVREAFFNLNFKLFQQLTGRHFTLKGEVVAGKALARTLGFPTANLDTSSVLPSKKGVYLCEIKWKTKWCRAVMNIGDNPTIGGSNPSKPKVEVHILDPVEEELLGSKVVVRVLDWIRGEEKFNNLEELRQAIQKDVEEALARFISV